jgi:outer membrane lipoprotein SlyB
MKKVVLRVVLLGLVAGGLCGAAVGLGYASPLAGVAGAVLVGIAVGALVARAKKEG